MKINTMYATYKDCYLVTDTYRANGTLAIQIMGDCGDGYLEPIATLTVCLVNENKANETRAYVDTNNCPWAMDFIEKYKLGEETGLYGLSGYCMYPLVEFNMEKVKEACA